VLPIRSQEYRNVVRLRYEQHTGKYPSVATFNNAIGATPTPRRWKRARKKCLPVRVPSMTARSMSPERQQRRIVKVTRDGWEIVSEAPMFFRYPKSQFCLCRSQRRQTLWQTAGGHDVQAVRECDR